MGSTIGDNTIVGASSVVSGTYPDNVVIAGNPARVICSIEDFYKKRKRDEIQCAFTNVKECMKKYHRYPTISEMGDAFAWLYLPRCEETFELYPGFFSLKGDDLESMKRDFMNSKGVYNSYEEFLEAYELQAK